MYQNIGLKLKIQKYNLMTTNNVLHTLTELTCIHYQTTPLQLKYASRKQPYAEARQAIWLMAKNILWRDVQHIELAEMFNREKRTAVTGIISAKCKYSKREDFRKFVDDTEKEVRRLIKTE